MQAKRPAPRTQRQAQEDLGRAPPSAQSHKSEQTRWLQGGGEMGKRLRAHDWEPAIGPPMSWPISLRVAVSLMLGSRQPVCIAWGSQLTTLYNDAYIPIMGIKHPDALGIPYRDVWPEIWERSRKPIEATFRGEPQYFIDEPVPLTGRPGRPMSWFTVSWTPLRDDHGTVAGFYCVASETTDRMMAHQAMERRVATRTAELYRRAEQLSRLTSELTVTEQRERRRLAKMVHDHLQQTIAAARVSLDVAARDMRPADRKRLERTGALIDAVQCASRDLSVELSPPVLHEMGLPAGLRWLADWMKEMHGLTVGTDIDDNTDPERDDMRILLFESARELLFNVVKHAGVSDASLGLAQETDGSLCLTVADEGRGVDVERLEQAGDGTQFGLFSIRERFLSMGGVLECDSAPGSGARFALRLPGPHGADIAPAHAAPSAALSGGPSEQDLIRVLVADNRTLLREGLAILIDVAAGMVVVGESRTGADAQRKAVSLKPDVVLMDYALPGGGGVEATRRIISEIPQVRVIGMTDGGSRSQAHAMLQAGAAACVDNTRPSARLLDCIRDLCQKRHDSAA